MTSLDLAPTTPHTSAHASAPAAPVAKKARSKKSASNAPARASDASSRAAAQRKAAEERLAALESELLTTDLLTALGHMSALHGVLSAVRNSPRCPWSRDAVSALLYLLSDLAARFEADLPQPTALALRQARGTQWTDAGPEQTAADDAA